MCYYYYYCHGFWIIYCWLLSKRTFLSPLDGRQSKRHKDQAPILPHSTIVVINNCAHKQMLKIEYYDYFFLLFFSTKWMLIFLFVRVQFNRSYFTYGTFCTSHLIQCSNIKLNANRKNNNDFGKIKNMFVITFMTMPVRQYIWAWNEYQ